MQNPATGLLKSCVLALLVFFALPASATLPRTPGSWVFGPTAVWTDGTTTGIFHPLSAPMPSAGVRLVRVSLEMSQDSGNCKMRPAFRYSNDGIAWDTHKDFGFGYRTSPGIDWGDTYVDISQFVGFPPRAYVQFGVEVANEGGSAINICNAMLRIDPDNQ